MKQKEDGQVRPDALQQFLEGRYSSKSTWSCRILQQLSSKNLRSDSSKAL